MRIEYLDPDEIVIDEKNVRKDVGSLRELRESIQGQNRVLFPCKGYYKNNKVYVYVGQRRVLACKELKEKFNTLIQVPVIIEDQVEEKTILEESLIENLQRDDLNNEEKYNAVTRLLELYNDNLEIVSKRLGLHKDTVKSWLRFGILRDTLQTTKRGDLTEALKELSPPVLTELTRGDLKKEEVPKLTEVTKDLPSTKARDLIKEYRKSKKAPTELKQMLLQRDLICGYIPRDLSARIKQYLNDKKLTKDELIESALKEYAGKYF